MVPITTAKSAYNDVTVWQTDDGYDFEVAGGTHATWSHTRILTGYIWDALTAATLLHKGPATKRILVLGFGGGTVVRQILHFLPRARITALEIDPVMLDLAKTYMQAGDLNAEILLGDGYAYAMQAGSAFDVIIDDIFVGLESGVVRPTSLQHDAVADLQGALRPGGILIANMIIEQTRCRALQIAKQAFRNNFTSTRQIRPSKGYNAGLIGGDTAQPDTLQEFQRCLVHPLDKRDWSNIRARVF
jgi:spermidine synthase